MAEFWISRNGLDIEQRALNQTNSDTLDHLYLNQIYPLALSRQMELVLHGAAVEVGESAIAILGLSGMGKSTLTASFAQHGWRFLTDDGLRLEWSTNGILAVPSHPSIRLWDDSISQIYPHPVDQAPPLDFTPKARLLAGQSMEHCPVPRELKTIYLLGNEAPNSVTITQVSPRNAMIEMVKHSFLLDVEEDIMLRHHFEHLSRLAQSVPTFELNYPRNYQSLEEVRTALIQHSMAPGSQGYRLK